VTLNLIIGNIISLIAAFFTAKSSLAHDRWNIYICQCAQCLLLAVASVFFNSYAGIVTLLVCALRNYLAASDRLNARWTLACLVLVLVPGILLNNRGAVGCIVIFTNVVYTAGMFFARKEVAVKCNMIFNLALWMVYEALIFDIPSLIADAIAAGAAVWSLIRPGTGERRTGNR